MKLLLPIAACVAAVAAAPLAVAPLAAQNASPVLVRNTGVILGVAANVSSINSEDLTDGTDTGGGLDLRAGYAFTRNLALVLGLTGAAVDGEGDTYGLGHFDLGFRYSFANPQRALVPYLEVAGTLRVLSQEDSEPPPGSDVTTTEDLVISGAGFTFGGGLQYFIAPAWALGADLRFTNGEFSDVEYGDVTVDGFEFDATTTRLSLGISWFPQRQRDR